MPQEATKLALIGNAKFATDKPNEIRAQLKSLLDAGEIRLRDIERITSYKGPTISQHLADKYEGDKEKLDDALMRFYRSWIAKNAIVQTRVVEDIHSIMLLAWRRKEIALIRGKFGRGKSKAASRFAALHEFAVFVELSGITSPTELLHRVAEALNIESQMTGSRGDKLAAIIRSLQRNPRLIVIDEADELRPRTLALLRDIHGERTERCAIVLIATERFDNILKNPELGYLRRRITIKRDIGELALDEARAICRMWPTSISNDSIKEAYSWSSRHFGVASLVNIMMRAYDVMQLKGEEKIDDDCMDEAYAYLMD